MDCLHSRCGAVAQDSDRPYNVGTMSDALKAFIHRRRQELDSDEQSLRHRLKAIETEREQLRKAAEAVGLGGVPELGPPPQLPAGMVSNLYRHPLTQRTIKQRVLEILEGDYQGMTAQEILFVLNEKFGTEYPRTSLSPQLSRLKAEGKIELDGSMWKLVRRERSASKLAELFEGKAEGT